MPTYDYKCKECDHQFETVQSMLAEPLADCSECGGALKRLIGTGAGIIFKGSGFYATDYRSDSYKSDAKKETGSASAKSEPAAESKKPKASTSGSDSAST